MKIQMMDKVEAAAVIVGWAVERASWVIAPNAAGRRERALRRQAEQTADRLRAQLEEERRARANEWADQAARVLLGSSMKRALLELLADGVRIGDRQCWWCSGCEGWVGISGESTESGEWVESCRSCGRMNDADEPGQEGFAKLLRLIDKQVDWKREDLAAQIRELRLQLGDAWLAARVQEDRSTKLEKELEALRSGAGTKRKHGSLLHADTEQTEARQRVASYINTRRETADSPKISADVRAWAFEHDAWLAAKIKEERRTELRSGAGTKPWGRPWGCPFENTDGSAEQERRRERRKAAEASQGAPELARVAPPLSARATMLAQALTLTSANDQAEQIEVVVTEECGCEVCEGEAACACASWHQDDDDPEHW